jgi:hypothetical protein
MKIVVPELELCGYSCISIVHKILKTLQRIPFFKLFYNNDGEQSLERGAVIYDSSHPLRIFVLRKYFHFQNFIAAHTFHSM